MMGKTTVLIAGLVSATLASPTFAGEPVASELAAAQNLFTEGVSLLRRQEWERGCRKFDESAALLPRASTLVKIAICLQHGSKYVATWEALQRARELNTEDPAAYRPDLEREIQQELAQVPTIRIAQSGSPVGLELYLDDQPLRLERVAGFFPVELGPHVLRAEAPGYAAQRIEIDVASAGPRVIDVNLQPQTETSLPPTPGPAPMVLPAKAPPPPPPSVVATHQPPDRPLPEAPPLGRQQIAGITLGSVGIVGLGVAGALGIRTLMLVSDSNPDCRYPDGSCNQQGVNTRNDASKLQNKAFILAGVGAAALAAGGYLYFSAPERRGTLAVSLAISPLPDGGAGLSGRASF